MDTGRGNNIHQGLFWGGGRGAWEEIALGEIPNVDDGVMGAANHHSTFIPV